MTVQGVPITKNTEGVTTSANTANVLSKIFAYKIPERILRGLRNGTVIILKLKTSEEVEIPETSKLVFGARKPGMSVIKELATVTYDAWKNLTLAEQQDTDNQAWLRIRLTVDGVMFRPQESFEIWLESSSAVDWTQSSITFYMDDLKIS